MFHTIMMIDQNILLWIQDTVRMPALTTFFTFITRMGDAAAVWIVLSVCLLASKRTRIIGIMALCSLGFSFIIDNVLLKNLIGRVRPYEVVQGLQCLIEVQTDFSFPSGHTGSSFAVAVVLLTKLPKKYGVPALMLAVLIGFSRLYLGVHYPTDVLCGALIGTMIAILVCCTGNLIVEWYAKRRGIIHDN